MAFKRYKRFRYRTRGKVYRSSTSRFRRRYRRLYRRRGGRRFPKNTECKSAECKCIDSWEITTTNNGTTVENFYPMKRIVLPSSIMPITQGTNINQRIGAKIKPIKLRLSGAVSLDRTPETTDNANQLPESFHIRLLVYQVRGGNINHDPVTQTNYHGLALIASSGYNCNLTEVKKILSYYSGPTQAPLTTYTNQHMLDNIGAAKTPLRLGIGGQFKMLYTKTFVLDNTKTCTRPFRIVTKCPNRLVWPETKFDTNTNPTNAPAEYVRNAIYVAWLLVPQSTRPKGRVYLNYTCQLFYTDK